MFGRIDIATKAYRHKRNRIILHGPSASAPQEIGSPGLLYVLLNVHYDRRLSTSVSPFTELCAQQGNGKAYLPLSARTEHTPVVWNIDSRCSRLRFDHFKVQLVRGFKRLFCALPTAGSCSDIES